MKKVGIIFICIILISCNRRIANYKVTPNGYKVWRKTKPSENVKDILSNGDTLVIFADKVGYEIIPHK